MSPSRSIESPPRPAGTTAADASTGAGASKAAVLMVGNFLSEVSATRQVCEELAAALRAGGRQVVTTSSKPGRSAKLADMTLTTWSRRHDYAVAHVDVFSGPSFAWAEAVGGMLRSLGKPHVLTLHGGGLPGFARRHPARVRRLLRAASIVTTPSPYLLRELAPYRADMLLIPNPIGLRDYPYRVRQAPRPRIVWLRAFHRIYNPSLAPRMVSLLRPEQPDVSLTMIGPDKGDGAYADTLRLIGELGLSGHVTCTGGVPKALVPARLAEHDIFINTTNVDNTPVSVLEAMACGLCVVSTDVGGIPYLLDDETDALLVTPDDPVAMAGAVSRLLREDGLAARLSANARITAARSDWSRVLPRWERLFDGLGHRGG